MCMQIILRQLYFLISFFASSAGWLLRCSSPLNSSFIINHNRHVPLNVRPCAYNLLMIHFHKLRIPGHKDSYKNSLQNVLNCTILLNKQCAAVALRCSVWAHSARASCHRRCNSRALFKYFYDDMERAHFFATARNGCWLAFNPLSQRLRSSCETLLQPHVRYNELAAVDATMISQKSTRLRLKFLRSVSMIIGVIVEAEAGYASCLPK